MQAKEAPIIKISRIEETRESGQESRQESWAFAVMIREGPGGQGSGGSETRHKVTLARLYAERLAAGHRPEDIIDAAFRFLLDREPKEQILAQFDLSLIARYFPEFERELPRYLR